MIKLKFSVEKLNQVNLDMFKKDAWFKTRTKIKDSKCQNCGRSYKDLDCDISFLSVHGELNKHICRECGEMCIKLGAIDIKKGNELYMKNKNELITNIRELKNYNENGYKTKLEDMKIDELETLFQKQLEIKKRQDRIDSITISEEDQFMEPYLKTEYDVIQDIKYLKCEEQIEEYFKDCGSDFFDCGQGYYEDEVNKIIKIGKKFFEVTIKAEIGSAKQDRGDRLYWIEKIETVNWKEIEKPKIKERIIFSYTFNLNVNQKEQLDSYLNNKNFLPIVTNE